MDDRKVINCLKGLVIDGVHYAKSGHPGGAMSSADFAYILFSEYLNFNPRDPDWLGRDRFILSAGHESMLQYALLYGMGWLERSDLETFRRLHSRTPGHPENTLTPGIECATGPLGQGCGMSVGFALGSTYLAAAMDEQLFGGRTWVLLGDGCMQECITMGAASLAGHLGLGNLIWYYDKNARQISGNISRSTSDDEVQIFTGLGWHVEVIDGHNLSQIRTAIQNCLNVTDKPSLIVGHTRMANGAASMEGMHQTHGEPFPAAERSQTKLSFGIPAEEDFYWPEDVSKHFKRRFADLETAVKAWNERLADKKTRDSGFAAKMQAFFSAPKVENLERFPWDLNSPIATRNAFGSLIVHWAEALPNLIGGSADLEPSNMTGAFAKKYDDFSKLNRKGRNISFGVREFPMSALTNGLALYGGFIPFDATFLTFADYSRPALRLGALQKCRVIHEFTHDSFYLGEDGPTHQPVEHLMSLRAMPGMYVLRPADPQETEVLLRTAIGLEAPSSLCLTRQKVPYLKKPWVELEQAARGAWIVQDARDADVIIYATGSEVHLALQVAADLKQADKGYARVCVVSVPCWELFEEQSCEYKKAIMRPECKRRVSIEAGVTLGWQRFVGLDGLSIGLDHFGASAPANELEVEFGFTPGAICSKIAEFFSPAH